MLQSAPSRANTDRTGPVTLRFTPTSRGVHKLKVNVKSDAMWVSMEYEGTRDMVGSEGDVSRVRVTLEGERRFTAESGTTFTPNAETGTGVEVGAGLRYSAGSLSIEGRVRTLVAHEDSGYEEWDASGAITVTPSASGRGLALRIAPTWGHTESATERLWGSQ